MAQWPRHQHGWMGHGPSRRPQRRARPAPQRRRRGPARAGRAVAAAGPAGLLRRAAADRGPGLGRGACLGRARAGDSGAGGGDRDAGCPPQAQPGLLRARRGGHGGGGRDGGSPAAGSAITTTNTHQGPPRLALPGAAVAGHRQGGGERPSGTRSHSLLSRRRGVRLLSLATVQSAILKPSQYASTLGRRLPRTPISRTSGDLPAEARKNTSIPSA